MSTRPERRARGLHCLRSHNVWSDGFGWRCCGHADCLAFMTAWITPIRDQPGSTRASSRTRLDRPRGQSTTAPRSSRRPRAGSRFLRDNARRPHENGRAEYRPVLALADDVQRQGRIDVAQNDTNRRSAIDTRTMRHPGYRVSMIKRK
jgi:hypothetical protein